MAMRVSVLPPHVAAALNEQRVSATAAALFTPHLPPASIIKVAIDHFAG